MTVLATSAVEKVDCLSMDSSMPSWPFSLVNTSSRSSVSSTRATSSRRTSSTESSPILNSFSRRRESSDSNLSPTRTSTCSLSAS